MAYLSYYLLKSRQMKNGVIFNDDRSERYLLTKIWEPETPVALVVMLNPSISDETRDSKTLKRLFHLLIRNGYGGCHIINIYPKVAKKATLNTLKWKMFTHQTHTKPVLEEKDFKDCILAWGTRAPLEHQRYMLSFIKYYIPDVPLLCFRQNKDGSPAHPLLLPTDLKLKPYNDHLL